MAEYQIPQSKEEADQVERALAKEFEKLSVDEREQVLYDIHGVRENSFDEEESMSTKLEELQRELSLLIASKKAPAYEQALSLNRAYVEDEAFRKLFLRVDELDAKKAAERLVLHFQVKQELFVQRSSTENNNKNNNEILVRNVTWDDLDEDDRTVVSSGLHQMGSARDVAGRSIVFVAMGVMQSGWKLESITRALWYVGMSSVLTDPVLRTKGAVTINLGASLPPLYSIRQIIRVRWCLPYATVAMHYCYDNPAVHIAVVGYRMLLFAFNAQQSFRTRFHYGNLEQIAFELQTFGIPVEKSPFSRLFNNNNNNQPTTPLTLKEGMSLAWHLEWLQSIRDLEQQRKLKQQKGALPHQTASDETVCIIPRRFDVLFGRQKLAWDHPGSVRCRYLVQEHHEEYEQASRRAKTQVANKIMALMAEKEGRFLRWAERTKDAEESGSGGGGAWVVVEEKVAREKVSHMFRHLRSEKASGRHVPVKDVDDNEDGVVTPMPLESTVDASRVAAKKTSLHMITPAPKEPSQRKLRRIDP